MAGYYIRRVLVIIPTLFVVILITFVIMHATPGGPFDTNPDSRTNDPRVQDRLMRAYGLDKPLFVNTSEMQQALDKGQGPIVAAGALFDGQFEAFMINLVQFKLGPSYRYRGQNPRLDAAPIIILDYLEPTEPSRKDDNQYDAADEVWHADTNGGEEEANRIKPRVLPQCSNQAKRKAEQQRNDERKDAEQERRSKAALPRRRAILRLEEHIFHILPAIAIRGAKLKLH